MYNYLDEIKKEIMFQIKEENIVKSKSKDEIAKELYERFANDIFAVGSCSKLYRYKQYELEDYVKENIELLKMACNSFDISLESLENLILDEDWCYLDSLIRKFLLSSAINELTVELFVEYTKKLVFLNGGNEYDLEQILDETMECETIEQIDFHFKNYYL